MPKFQYDCIPIATEQGSPQEAQNLHQLKSPLSDLTSWNFQKLFFYQLNLESCYTMFTFRGIFIIKFGSKRCIFMGLFGMYFDAVVVEVKTFLLLFRLALAILCAPYIEKMGPWRFALYKRAPKYRNSNWIYFPWIPIYLINT